MLIDLTNLGHKAVAAAVQRGNQGDSTLRLPDGLAHPSQTTRQGRIADIGLGPTLLQKLVARDYPLAVREQVPQHCQYLGLEQDDFVHTAQLTPDVVKDTVTKAVPHTAFLRPPSAAGPLAWERLLFSPKGNGQWAMWGFVLVALY
jgi:hypothetical protein